MSALDAELVAGLEALGLPVEADTRDRLLRFLEELLRWNRRVNLTAITDPLAALRQHLLDSLSVVPHLRGPSLLDVGSGGGLPGLPLAIVRPDLAVHSVESRQKKVSFQRHAAAVLGLGNFRAEAARVEAMVAVYPQVISRAFASLARFVELAGPRVAPGGELLAMKGHAPEDELAALPSGWQLVTMPRLTVPGLQAQRHLVILRRREEGPPAP